jgi:large subunit ribosomal protein L21
MSYAVIELGGRQWRVVPGDKLDVNRVAGEAGASHVVEQVLLAHDGAQVQIGRPYVQGAKVVCEVVDQRRGPKVISYKYRRRENWRKTVGHRQDLTRLIVKEISVGGKAVAAAEPKARTAKAAGSKTPSVVKKKHSISKS